MKLFKFVKHVWLYLKWQRSDEYKLFELLLELRSEVLTNNFKKFNSYNGICGNTAALVFDRPTVARIETQLLAKFVELYPHAPDVVVDTRYMSHYYPVEGNPKSYYESFRLNQLWFNPRRLQLLDFMIMELYNIKPEL